MNNPFGFGGGHPGHANPLPGAGRGGGGAAGAGGAGAGAAGAAAGNAAAGGVGGNPGAPAGPGAPPNLGLGGNAAAWWAYLAMNGANAAPLFGGGPGVPGAAPAVGNGAFFGLGAGGAGGHGGGHAPPGAGGGMGPGNVLPGGGVGAAGPGLGRGGGLGPGIGAWGGPPPAAGGGGAPGVGAAGFFGGGAGGWAVPPGVPPAGGAGGFAVPPGGGGAGAAGYIPQWQQARNIGLGYMPGVPPAVPEPGETSGPLGRVCYDAGATDGRGILAEFQPRWETMVPAANFNVDNVKNALLGSMTPWVLLTVNPLEARVETLFGFGMADLGGQLGVTLVAFRGDGSLPANASLVFDSDSLAGLGGAVQHDVVAEQILDIWFRQHPGQLVRLQANTVTQPVTTTTYMPCPNALVYAFADAPHPYVAHLRLRELRGVVPAFVLDKLLDWLRSACHIDVGETASRMTSHWLGVPSTNSALWLAADNRLSLLIPRPAPPVDRPEGITEERAREVAREEARAGEARQRGRGGRQLNDHQWTAVKGWANLDRNMELDDPRVPPFVQEWHTTPSRHADMLELWKRMVSNSANELGYGSLITAYRDFFITGCIKDWLFGQDMDESYSHCHKGFSICAFWAFMVAPNEPSNPDGASHNATHNADVDLDECIRGATLQTTEDRRHMAGKPRTAPTTVSDLLLLVKQYILELHAKGDYNGDHCVKVRQMKEYLEKWQTAKSFEEFVPDIYWRIFLDSRRFFSQQRGHAESGLALPVIYMKEAQWQTSSGLPHEISSLMTGRAPKRQRVDPPLSSGGGGGGGNAGGGPKKEPAHAFGKLSYYCKPVRDAWAQVCAACTKKGVKTPMIKTVVGKVMDPDGKPYNMGTFGELLKPNCTIGTVTGQCNKPGCKFDHSTPVEPSAAEKAGSIILKGWAKHGSS